MFIENVVRSLNKHKVAYALVGGYAVALHGAIRGTVDIDIVIRLEQTAFSKLQQAMEAIGLVSRLPVSAEEVFAFRQEYIHNRNLIAWSFYNPANPLEVVDVLIADDVRDMQTVIKQLGSLKIVVASIDDLIALKREAGRAQDLEDVKALEKLRNL